MTARGVVRAAGALLAVTLAAACGADRTDIAAKAPLEGTDWELDTSTVQVPGIEQAQPTLELAQEGVGEPGLVAELLEGPSAFPAQRADPGAEHRGRLVH